MRHYKEFNFDEEAEGAPVRCRSVAWTPHVFKRSRGRLFGTLTENATGKEVAATWDAAGFHLVSALVDTRGNPTDLVMAPLDYVEGQPVYQGDTVYRGRRKVAVNARQSEAVTGMAPPWAGATLEPHEPQIVMRHLTVTPLPAGHETIDEICKRRGLIARDLPILPDTRVDQSKIKLATDEHGRLCWAYKDIPEAPAPVGSELWKARQAARIETNMTREEWHALLVRTVTAPFWLGTFESGNSIEQEEAQWYQHMKAEISSTIIARAIADGQVAPVDAAAKLDAAINQVQAAAPRVMLEKVAARMKQTAMRALCESPNAIGWTMRDVAAGIVRQVDINAVVDQVLADAAGQGVKS